MVWTAGGACRADGEDLAEGDVESWLDSIKVPLSDCGVELDIKTNCSPHDPDSAGYSVTINGTEIALYALDPADPHVPVTEDPWMDCTIKPAAQVNRLLAAAGSVCRLAVFWPGGNDGFSVLGPQSVLVHAVASVPADRRPDVVFPA